MDDKIKDYDIPQSIAEIESRSNTWNFRKATSYKKKQKELEEVAKLFGVSGKYLQIVFW